MIREYQTLNSASTICIITLSIVSCCVIFSPFCLTSKQEQVIVEQYGVFVLERVAVMGIARFMPVVSVALDDFVLVLHDITCVVCRVLPYSLTPHRISLKHVWIHLH